MPEWRKDPLVERWVVIATERGKRPCDFKVPVDEKKEGRCPLCPGNEKETPPEIIAFREQGTRRDTPGWWVRVVPNKFPAVRVEAKEGVRRHGVYELMDGLGAHEVVVEAPDHDAYLVTQNNRQFEEVIWAWRQRHLDLRRDSRLKYIHVFKNFGQTAGASLEHTHSQIIATPMIPVDVREELQGMRRYTQATGRCILCDVLDQEMAERQRVVTQTDKFLSFAPFASRFPFETWIVPREHQHDFGEIRPDQVPDMARVLRDTLLRLRESLGGPPYNLVLHTAPVNETDTMHYHWHVEILPRLTIMAGFELGTGFYINPTPPELAASTLREQEVFCLPPVMEHAQREVTRYV
ncbi:MAG TPA: galactose-1-phosphate uridylyltransferase [Desulfotomaculum sp.]|nr:galactose-1-phosphate uridylyltransferase [Desulfotomaculum sp.]